MAMLVMAVGLLGLLQSVIVAYQHDMKNRFRAEATLVAEKRMHEWTRQPFVNISTVNDLVDVDNHQVGGTPWSCTVTRKAQLAGSTTGSKKLTVVVTWTERGETTSHEICTLRTRRVGE